MGIVKTSATTGRVIPPAKTLMDYVVQKRQGSYSYTIKPHPPTPRDDERR
ncbi:MAG TPA: hypothetical protein VH008_00520 [Pseudonocardia sp.]|jgi:hypothetical protein|nr:hypothetical protein [Pseudonocardia sp.]